jgi:hypothetical protein
MFVILTHWSACMWHAALDDSSDDTGQSWLRNISEDRQQNPWRLYVTCANAAFLMLYGENIGATTTKEEMVSMLLMLIGACVQATIFGQVALLISNNNSIIGKFKEKQEVMNENMEVMNNYWKVQTPQHHIFQ